MSDERARTRISLLGGFELEVEGPTVIIPEGSQRLLAFLALQGRFVRRQTVAGTLWPIATEGHASSSLRSALSRLRGRARAAVEASAVELGVADDVTVDLWDAQAIARRLLEPASASDPSGPGAEAIPSLSAELLPDWYDDWALVEAEDWRQLRLHALEVLADRLTARGEYADAAAAALAAVRAEPLREFARYGDLLTLELGVEPTKRLRELVADLWADPRADPRSE